MRYAAARFRGMKRDAVPGMSINGRQASAARTAQGYRRFRCGNCGKQFNERNAGLLNRAQYPSDVIALVVLWRLRYKLSLRDLAEMFLIRGLVFSHEAVRDWASRRPRRQRDRSRDTDTANDHAPEYVSH